MIKMAGGRSTSSHLSRWIPGLMTGVAIYFQVGAIDQKPGYFNIMDKAAG